MDIRTSTQMATIYGLKSSVAFNKLLEKCGVLEHTSKGYVLSGLMRGWGYATVIETPYFLPNGIRATKKKAAWTEAGQHFIRQRLARFGILPVDEQNNLFETTN